MAKRLLFLLICYTAMPTFGQRIDTLGKADSSGKEPAIRLGTVTIRGQRPVVEHRIDGIVFNVAGLAAFTAVDAADLLRKVPMVSIDVNGGLAVRGSTNVRVWIDGKPSEIYAPSVAEALRAVRAGQIVKVEVITDPPARYDAQGTDAVINIITRKLDDKITSGNIGAVLGNRSSNLMGDIHHQRGPLQIHADAFYQGYHNQNGSVLVRTVGFTSLRQETETRQTGHYFYGGFSLSYSIDSLNTLSAGFRPRRSSNITDAIVNNYDTPDGSPEFLFSRLMETPVSAEGNSYNFGFNGQTTNKKTDYALLGTYVPSELKNAYSFLQSDLYDNLYSEAFNNAMVNKEYMLQGDYSHSFSGGWKFESGGKLSVKEARSKTVYEPDAGRSATFWYNSKVYAGYTDLAFSTDKWGFNVGLRYERTELDAVFRNKTEVNRSFGNLMPQGLLQLALNDKASLRLGYTRKLMRPVFSALDPTANMSDSLTLQYGNPQLNREVTNRYQISYSVNKPKLFTDLVFSFHDNHNSIANIRTPMEDGRFESTWKNLGKNQRWTLSATFNWKPSAVSTFGGTLTATYVRLENNALGISNSGILRQLNVSASYTLSHGYSLDAYLYFDGNDLSLQGYRSGWKFYNLTINKKVSEKLNISLRGETFLTRHTFIDEVFESASYSQKQIFRYQNQNLRLSVSYKLGKREVKDLGIKPFDLH
ncbi:outer membrane beta-barrel protein [Pedobacter sp. JY14-1]|uniref:outer membrane beta-barrel protein n=1 Tax=Pedobacter sp. JY14-1 TaxID=3034151 RepID=UPI0023E0E149|nr:outer membrane beta-barrel protein [Pedobacter sp. JY14-1]